jgi:hypothetical protein
MPGRRPPMEVALVLALLITLVLVIDSRRS